MGIVRKEELHTVGIQMQNVSLLPISGPIPADLYRFGMLAHINLF